MATGVARSEALDGVVQRLVAALRPERIYLFGSQARGDARADSDYDFLIVTPGAEPPSYALTVEGYAAAAGRPGPVDLVFYSRATFDRHATVVTSLPATVLREGQLLYATDEAKTEDGAGMAEDDAKLELTHEWLAKAHQDLVVAERALVVPALPAIVGFHAQQAAEKALKAFLTWHDVIFPKTHVLEELIDLCVPVDAAFAGWRPMAIRRFWRDKLEALGSYLDANP